MTFSEQLDTKDRNTEIGDGLGAILKHVNVHKPKETMECISIAGNAAYKGCMAITLLQTRICLQMHYSLFNGLRSVYQDFTFFASDMIECCTLESSQCCHIYAKISHVCCKWSCATTVYPNITKRIVIFPCRASQIEYNLT